MLTLPRMAHSACTQGMRDYGAKEMSIRESVFNTIVNVFQRHGATALDTPVMELKVLLIPRGAIASAFVDSSVSCC